MQMNSANNVSYRVLNQLPTPMAITQTILFHKTMSVPDVPSLTGYEISAANSKNNGTNAPSKNPMMATNIPITRILFFCVLSSSIRNSEFSSNGDGNTKNNMHSIAIAKENIIKISIFSRFLKYLSATGPIKNPPTTLIPEMVKPIKPMTVSSKSMDVDE